MRQFNSFFFYYFAPATTHFTKPFDRMACNLKPNRFLTASLSQSVQGLEILDKILPYEARAEFSQIFRSFGGNGVSRKNVFEIY